MTDDRDDSEDPNHIQTASKSTRLGVLSLFLGIYHSILGMKEWIDNRGLIVRSFISGGIFVGVMWVLNGVGNAIFTTFWGQAVYMSGLNLRLLPIPVSLAIYILAVLFFSFGFSLDSSIRSQQSEIEELKSEINDIESELDKVKEDDKKAKEKSLSND